MRNPIIKKLILVGIIITVMTAIAPASVHAASHGSGSLILLPDGHTVQFIDQTSVRHSFHSGGALSSYGFLSFAQIATATNSDLTLQEGTYIPPRDGTIFCATETKGSDVKGECSLITGGQKAAFVSSEVFTGLGFNFKNAISGDSSFLTKTTNITSGLEAHRPGVLVNDQGTVRLVSATGLLGIPDQATFNSWGYTSSNIVSANSADKTLSQVGVMASRQPGQLNPTAIITTTNNGWFTLGLNESKTIDGYTITYLGVTCGSVGFTGCGNNAATMKVMLASCGTNIDTACPNKTADVVMGGSGDNGLFRVNGATIEVTVIGVTATSARLGVTFLQ